MSHHLFILFFFLMIRRPPRSTLSSSSAASDVYKRQVFFLSGFGHWCFNRCFDSIVRAFLQDMQGLHSQFTKSGNNIFDLTNAKTTGFGGLCMGLALVNGEQRSSALVVVKLRLCQLFTGIDLAWFKKFYPGLWIRHDLNRSLSVDR
eukprot:TRINITY_DN28970_c0_g1_i2.p3 TRINITY_DN28970_c0_g1~~TRINITY_DN28970_c0_g1_i2.p3  ORF type:complete len:147 (-),score=20.67 TRINITY_DN28970_c0_g1_i2:887-1327(-)